MTAYDDFVIHIGPPADGFHTVTVIQSPAGKGGRGRFPAAWSPAAVAAPSADPTGTRDFKAAGTPANASVPVPPSAMGAGLYEALVSGDIESLFEQSLGTSLARGRRLRVRLQLNVEHEGVAPLATVPWELMYRHKRREHLVLSPDTTIVRSLDVPVGAYNSPPITGPIRILFVTANPRGDLDLRAERTQIEQQLAADVGAGTLADNVTARRPIAAEFLEDATFAQLEDRLRDRDYHVIHFMGHGTFDDRHRGQLLFHDGMRSGSDLGEVLKRERTTRLVTLNACRTAEGSAEAGADPFAGVASALVMAGVPAVVAMQFPVSDMAAIAFSARLYSALARGEPLEEAVDSGRMRIKALAPDQREWATPVLFLGDTTPFQELVDKPSAPSVPQHMPAAATAPMAAQSATAPATPPQPVVPGPPAQSPAPAARASAMSTVRRVVVGALALIGALVVALMVFTPDDSATVPPEDAPVETAPPATSQPAEPAQGTSDNLDFLLDNQTGLRIDQLFVSPAHSDRWGDDVLGTASLLHGAAEPIAFAPGDPSCMWDLKVVLQNGKEIEWASNVDLCKATEITLFFDKGAPSIALK